MGDKQIEQTEIFHKLHQPGNPLILCNAWDAGSAAVIELAGAKAIATTSSGLAAANGYPDGEKLPRAQLVNAVSLIMRVVKVPVTVDIERGFGQGGDVTETIRGITDAGATGINLEDGSLAPEVLIAKIRDIREFVQSRGVGLFINARTDVYLRGLVSAEARFDETVRRVRQYSEAGADGAFVPGVTDQATIANLAKAIPLPLNVMVQEGLAPVSSLREAGVARISTGGWATFAALSLTHRMAQEIFGEGTYTSMLSGVTLNRGEFQRMLR